MQSYFDALQVLGTVCCHRFRITWGFQNMRVTLIHNPESGDDDQPGSNEMVYLMQRRGYEVTCRSYRDQHGEAALDEPTDLVAIAGGDGTIRRVAQRMMGRDIALTVIPMGTANNIARTLGMVGIPLERQIAGWEHARSIAFDVGTARGSWGVSHFLEGCGIGLFARLVREADAHPTLTNLPTAEAKIEYALQMLTESLRDCPSTHLRVTLDGRDLSGGYLLFEVMNTRYIGPNLHLAPGSDPGDGWLDVVVARDTDRELLLRHLSSGQNRQQHWPALSRQRARSLSMQWTGSALHLDDHLEMSDGGDVEIAIRPGEVRFLLPHCD